MKLKLCIIWLISALTAACWKTHNMTLQDKEFNLTVSVNKQFEHLLRKDINLAGGKIASSGLQVVVDNLQTNQHLLGERENLRLYSFEMCVDLKIGAHVEQLCRSRRIEQDYAQMINFSTQTQIVQDELVQNLVHATCNKISLYK